MSEQDPAKPIEDGSCESCPSLAHAEAIATRAAHRALEAFEHRIRENFLRLGIDTDDLDSLAYWQDNLQFLARANRGSKQVSSVIVKTCVGAVVSGLLWLIWVGFKAAPFTPIVK